MTHSRVSRKNNHFEPHCIVVKVNSLTGKLQAQLVTYAHVYKMERDKLHKYWVVEIDLEEGNSRYYGSINPRSFEQMTKELVELRMHSPEEIAEFLVDQLGLSTFLSWEG